ncbi:MAG: prepilin peptidase [Acetobacteraceae bacterium]|nr:prepilin peptidase [Acetobacteraceae bacterium]
MLLLIAAWRDLATRLIPDTLCLLIAVIGFAGRAAEGLTEAAVSLALAIGLFLLLLPAAARGALGGGDVKLASALLLGFGPAAAWDFIFFTVMLGGVLGLAYMAGPALVGPSRALPAGAPLLQRVLQVEYWRLRRRGPLPYAVAIAAGGIIVLLLPPGG